jgi:hypothetical protein
MPILADALEEAGCTDASILDHAEDVDRMFAGVGSLILSSESSEAGLNIAHHGLCDHCE